MSRPPRAPNLDRKPKPGREKPAVRAARPGGASRRGGPARPLLRRERRALAQERAAAKALEEPPPERRERRALTHVGGRIELAGDDEGLLRVLATALDVPRDEDSAQAHVHGFHSYAARLHPLTARRLIEGLSAPGQTVLDPYMGSGTIMVEARLLGRRGIGVDLNPLSLDLAHLKTRGTSAEERRALLAAAARVMGHADERRLTKAGPTRRYGPEDMELFDVHMLLELDGLRDGISLEPAGFAREALKLVLSAILVKVSRRPGDTVERTAPRRLATGFAIKLFSSKTAELGERLAAFAELLGENAKKSPECELAVDDARKLSTVKTGSADLVVTSPPYPGVYDYAHHHAARLRWLGLDAEPFERGEIGSRRKLRGKDREEGLGAWERDFVASLSAIARALRPKAKAILVVADSVVQKRAIYAEDTMERLAPRAGLSLVGIASQKRPHFHEPSREAFAGRPRREHLFALVK